MSRFIHAISLGLTMVLFVRGVAAEPMQLVVDGRSRTIVLERSGAPGARPTIIMLHGAGGDRTDYYFPDLAQIASRAGFVMVRPQGVGGRWNIFPPGKISAGDAQFFEQQGGIPDDVAFLKMVVADLTKRGISDPKRIYLAGLSLGGVMTLRIACVDVELFAGLGLFISAMPEVFGASCRMAKPVPVLMMSGTADQRLPYAGGRSAAGENIWATERLLGFLRGLNGCAQAPLRSALPGTHPQKIEIELSAKCSGAPVNFYRVVGGGHDVPRSMSPSQMLVEFFRDKVRDDPIARAAHPPLPIVARTFNHIMYRRYDGSTLVTGDVKRTAGNEWLETNTRGSRWSFRATAESSAELVLHDASRDIYVRMDLAAKRMYVRKGTSQEWVPLADIVWTDK